MAVNFVTRKEFSSLNDKMDVINTEIRLQMEALDRIKQLQNILDNFCKIYQPIMAHNNGGEESEGTSDPLTGRGGEESEDLSAKDLEVVSNEVTFTGGILKLFQINPLLMVFLIAMFLKRNTTIMTD